MIILDTNIIAALMRSDVRVLNWLDRQPGQSIWTTAVSVYETHFGIELLAVGRRKHELVRAFEGLLMEDLEARVVPFDTAAAESAGKIAAERRRTGRPVDVRDAQIAGIVLSRRATLATHNTRHFEGIGLSIVDPLAP